MKITERRMIGAVLLVLQGSADGPAGPELDQRLQALIGQGYIRLVIDFAQVDYITSAGLRILLAAQKKVRATKGDIRLLGVVRSVREIFQISGLDAAFTSFATLDHALQGFGLDGESTTNGSATVVVVRGRLEGAAVAAFEEYLPRSMEGGPAHLVLDLAGLTYASVEGLRSLNTATEKVQRSGGRVLMAGPQDTVVEALELLGILGKFQIYPRIDLALKALES